FRRLLRLAGGDEGTSAGRPAPVPGFEVRTEKTGEISDRVKNWSARLGAVFHPGAWRDLDRPTPLTPQQDAARRDLTAQVPAIEPDRLAEPPHTPERKALLAELGRRDASLAYRAAVPLWARDLAGLSPDLEAAARAWARGDEWACLAVVEDF